MTTDGTFLFIAQTREKSYQVKSIEGSVTVEDEHPKYTL